mgnify:CR=1 FL=1
MDGTVRTYHQEVRDFVETCLEEVVSGIAHSARATYKMKYSRIMPPANNDPQPAEKVTRLLNQCFEPDVVTADVPCEWAARNLRSSSRRIRRGSYSWGRRGLVSPLSLFTPPNTSLTMRRLESKGTVPNDSLMIHKTIGITNFLG